MLRLLNQWRARDTRQGDSMSTDVSMCVFPVQRCNTIRQCVVCSDNSTSGTRLCLRNSTVAGAHVCGTAALSFDFPLAGLLGVVGLEHTPGIASSEQCSLRCLQYSSCAAFGHRSDAGAVECRLYSASAAASDLTTMHHWQRNWSFYNRLSAGRCRITTITATITATTSTTTITTATSTTTTTPTSTTTTTTTNTTTTITETTTTTTAGVAAPCPGGSLPQFEQEAIGVIKGFMLGLPDDATVRTIEQCATWCLLEPKCLTFQWSPLLTTCSLKASTALRSNVVAQQKWQTKHTVFNKKVGLSPPFVFVSTGVIQGFSINLPVDATAASAKECASLCIATSDCAAFQWSDKFSTCSLKAVSGELGNVVAEKSWQQTSQLYNKLPLAGSCGHTTTTMTIPTTTTRTTTPATTTALCPPQFQKAAEVGAWSAKEILKVTNHTHLLSVEQCSARCLRIPGCTAFSISMTKKTCRYSKQGGGVQSVVKWQKSNVPYKLVASEQCPTDTPTTAAPATTASANIAIKTTTMTIPTTTTRTTTPATTTALCPPQFQKAAEVGAWSAKEILKVTNHTHLLSVEQCSARCLRIPGCTAFSISMTKKTCRYSKQGGGVQSVVKWQKSNVPYKLVASEQCPTDTPTTAAPATTASANIAIKTTTMTTTNAASTSTRCAGGELFRFAAPQYGLMTAKGSYLASKTANSSLEMCARRCIEWGPACAAFQFVPSQDHQCFLKQMSSSDAAPLAISQKWHASVAVYDRLPGNTPCRSLGTNTRFTKAGMGAVMLLLNMPLGLVKDVNLAGCEDTCWGETACLSFSYYRAIRVCRLSPATITVDNTNLRNTQHYHNQMVAYNKRQPVSTTSGAAAVEVTATAVATTIGAVRFTKVQSAGAVIALLGAALTSVTLEECKNRCWNTSGCLALSYFPAATACRLSPATVTGDGDRNLRNTQNYHNQMVVYEKRPSVCPCPCANIENSLLRYAEPVAGFMQGASMDRGSVGKVASAIRSSLECADACTQLQDCASFQWRTHSTPVCGLKHIASSKVMLLDDMPWHRTYLVYDKILDGTCCRCEG